MAIIHKDTEQSVKTEPSTLPAEATNETEINSQATAVDDATFQSKDVAPEAIVEPPTLDTLNAACEHLMTQLLGKGSDLLRDVGMAQHVPLWMVVVGLLQRCIDTGEYTAPILDPMWLQANEAVLSDFGYSTCQCGCNQRFKLRWPGQLYVDTVHATSVARAALDRAPSRLDLPPLGSEAPDTARSTIYQEESQPERFHDTGSIDVSHALTR